MGEGRAGEKCVFSMSHLYTESTPTEDLPAECIQIQHGVVCVELR